MTILRRSGNLWCVIRGIRQECYRWTVSGWELGTVHRRRGGMFWRPVPESRVPAKIRGETQ